MASRASRAVTAGRIWLFAAALVAAIEVAAAAGVPFGSHGLGSGERNFFNSEANLQVDSNDYVPACYGKPCDPIRIPEDPRSQRVVALLERYDQKSTLLVRIP